MTIFHGSQIVHMDPLNAKRSCPKRNVGIGYVKMHCFHGKVRKREKIRNRYNQALHLSQDTNGKVTTSQVDITTDANRSVLSQQVTTRHQHTDVHESIKKQDKNNINDPQKKHRLRTVSKNILLEGLNRFNNAPTSPLVKIWIKKHRCLVCMKDP